MQVLYVEDILEAGFKWISADSIKVTEVAGAHVVNRFLVHKSVEISRVCILHGGYILEVPGKVPYIEYYVPAAEWRAYAGAMTFHLTSEVQLWRFMKIFDYPLPIDKQ